jgi:hypothetical protein
VLSGDEIYFPKMEFGQKNYNDVSVMLCNKHPSYSTVRNWVARCRTRHLSTEVEEFSGRPSQVIIPDNMDATLHYPGKSKKSAKKIAGTLAIILPKNTLY